MLSRKFEPESCVDPRRGPPLQIDVLRSCVEQDALPVGMINEDHREVIRADSVMDRESCDLRAVDHRHANVCRRNLDGKGRGALEHLACETEQPLQRLIVPVHARSTGLICPREPGGDRHPAHDQDWDWTVHGHLLAFVRQRIVPLLYYESATDSIYWIDQTYSIVI